MRSESQKGTRKETICAYSKRERETELPKSGQDATTGKGRETTAEETELPQLDQKAAKETESRQRQKESEIGIGRPSCHN